MIYSDIKTRSAISFMNSKDQIINFHYALDLKWEILSNPYRWRRIWWIFCKGL